MDFTDEHSKILYRAWLLARDGNGQVIEAWAYPDAHELAEQAGSSAGWRTTAT